MAKLENYNGSVPLMAGITQNGGDFALVEANAIQVNEEGTRLDVELDAINGRAKVLDENTRAIEEIISQLKNKDTSLDRAIDSVNSNLKTKVPNTRTVNGKALKEDVTLNAEDVGALPSTTKLFSGNYNDLTDKPTIPSVDGLASEVYVDSALAQKSQIQIITWGADD